MFPALLLLRGQGRGGLPCLEHNSHVWNEAKKEHYPENIRGNHAAKASARAKDDRLAPHFNAVASGGANACIPTPSKITEES
jgi:hypothetical protein